MCLSAASSKSAPTGEKVYSQKLSAEARAKKNARQRAYYAENKERHAEKVSAWQAANPEKVRASSEKWRKGNPAAVREIKRRSDARSAGADYESTTRNEPALCEACGSPPRKYQLCWDHDHTTGRFRGWLCSGCNSALGLLKDDTNRILKLHEYLLKSTAQANKAVAA
jgi:hypothetical protein